MTCWLPSSGVPLMATSALTGNDSGGSGSLQESRTTVNLGAATQAIGTAARRDALAHLPDQADAVAVLLSESDNATTANAQAGGPDRLDRLEALVVLARGDHGRIELARGVEVVVVGGQAGLLQLLGLLRAQHTERRADFHVHSAVDESAS